MRGSNTLTKPYSHLLAVMTAMVISLHPATLLAAYPDWVLMSRHGECHEIDQVLRRRFDDIPPVTSPDDFVNMMRSRGDSRITVEPSQPSGAIMVELPDKGISLIFVRRSRCTEIIRRGE